MTTTTILCSEIRIYSFLFFLSIFHFIKKHATLYFHRIYYFDTSFGFPFIRWNCFVSLYSHAHAHAGTGTRTFQNLRAQKIKIRDANENAKLNWLKNHFHTQFFFGQNCRRRYVFFRFFLFVNCQLKNKDRTKTKENYFVQKIQFRLTDTTIIFFLLSLFWFCFQCKTRKESVMFDSRWRKKNSGFFSSRLVLFAFFFRIFQLMKNETVFLAIYFFIFFLNSSSLI